MKIMGLTCEGCGQRIKSVKIWTPDAEVRTLNNTIKVVMVMHDKCSRKYARNRKTKHEREEKLKKLHALEDGE